jgi:glucoamylase
MQTLDAWIEQQYRYSATAMLQSFSRVDIVKSRPGFGHAIRPVKGSIVASHVLGDWNPEPDYFFHWFRDSAVIVDSLRLLFETGALGKEALGHLQDFVRFSLSLQTLDGRTLVATPAWRAKVTEDFVRFLRKDEELAAVHGDSVVAETRVNPDGTLDISSWTRPQHDGAPLRAVALLRWLQSKALSEALRGEIAQLLHFDLAFTYKYWHAPAFDMWEEEQGLHYHTLCVSAAALEAGAAWLESLGNRELARTYAAEAEKIRARLDEFWLPDLGIYRSRIVGSGTRSSKDLDISVVFAAIHSADDRPTHSVHDPKIHATLHRLEALFDADYPINHNRGMERGPAMGRYAGDKYFSGGAYYFSTLGAAELCYRAGAGRSDAAAWADRGDAYLATVRAYTPAEGALSEQFDQRTGEQTSAKHLAWSYAAFISCITARRRIRNSRAAAAL